MLSKVLLDWDLKIDRNRSRLSGPVSQDDPILASSIAPLTGCMQCFPDDIHLDSPMDLRQQKGGLIILY